jgi:hypothetical protein
MGILSFVDALTVMHQDASQSASWGSSTIICHRVCLCQGPELLSKRDCYVAFVYDKLRKESEVKVSRERRPCGAITACWADLTSAYVVMQANSTAPVWDQEFIFDNVPYPPA